MNFDDIKLGEHYVLQDIGISESRKLVNDGHPFVAKISGKGVGDETYLLFEFGVSHLIPIKWLRVSRC
jgi:hypothetical protein